MSGPLSAVDWAIVLAYVVFALGVGVVYARRASQSVDEFFLSGRSLPWWIAGTSMVATSFAADTPLLITGWVRDDGIWRNWVWWCYAVNGMIQVFLFARWWRRAGVMTKAELVELRYGGSGARVLRGFLGVMHACVTNVMVLCWVLLAAAKISEVLFEVDKVTGLACACAVAMTYSLLAGFWGVVVTDLVQFVIAMVGAIALAWISWSAVGGSEGVLAAVADGTIPLQRLRFVPEPGEDAFWTPAVAAVFVYLGVSWWAVENVDGSGIGVQRISAARNEREGMLATLWFNVAHYALRPWCWILVGLASLLVLPTIEVRSPIEARVLAEGPDVVVLEPAEGDAVQVPLAAEEYAKDWRPLPVVDVGEEVAAGDLIARTDSERAYVVMMARYLPVGLLGLVAASLLAAFMSTIDTHVNLASSFFVNDVYRRFLHRSGGERHYVLVARLASVAVLLIGALVAWKADSVRDLFVFFLAFLAGMGPVYVLRWLWWRIRASTEIAAMITSATVSTAVTILPGDWAHSWRLGPLSPDGVLSDVGRVVLVALASMAAALLSLLATRTPDPRALVGFYRRTRPIGWWGPVRELAPDVEVPRREAGPALGGALGALAATYGLLFGLGFLFLGRPAALAASAVVSVLGTIVVALALRRVGARPAPEDGA